jgi:lysozyme family protein
MPRFEDCLAFVLAREGGFVDDPDDPGGATNYGITQRVYTQHRRLGGKPPASVATISQKEVATIYRSAYWKPMWCDVLPEPLDLVAFDSSVNHGLRQAAKFLQRAVGSEDDGVIGRQSMAGIREMVMVGRLGEVVADIIRQRGEFYADRVKKKPNQVKFLKGWKNRLAELAKACEGG